MLAVIFGITGQDGSYLAEHLLEQGYQVVGVKRRSSVDTNERIRHIVNEDFEVIEGDIVDPSSVIEIISEYKPDECYNLAAQSHVGTSFKQPSFTFQVNAVGPLNILEAIRLNSPDTKFYQASTSEMFGNNSTQLNINTKVQNESTPFAPASPYAAAKLAAHTLVQSYRKSYNIYGCNGILFNHESPRRGENFVTRKITRWIGEFEKWRQEYKVQDVHVTMSDDLILAKKHIIKSVNEPMAKWFPKLRLGNIDAHRDWGHAKDYVKAMHLMLQQDHADDYLVATGETHSVRDFLTEAFARIGIEDWESFIVIDPTFYRPNDVEFLLGDARKIRSLGWRPEHSFKQLVTEMVEADIEKAKGQQKAVLR